MKTALPRGFLRMREGAPSGFTRDHFIIIAVKIDCRRA
jgi:hypothetical protein